MELRNEELMYEFNAKNLSQPEALKQFSDHCVKEIKSIYGWDTEVAINVETESQNQELFSVSMYVYGLGEKLIVKKTGKHPLSTLRKVRKTIMRQIHRLSAKKANIRQRFSFKDRSPYHAGAVKNRYSENILTPVQFLGIIQSEGPADFKLLCASGNEYDFVCNEVWKETLTRYHRQEVKVIGLLNSADFTLIPQKILPLDPPAEVENIVDLAALRTEKFLKTLIKGIKPRTPMPAAFCA